MTTKEVLNKEFLEDLHKVKKLTPFEISELTSVNKDEIISLLKEYNLYSDIRDRKFRLINKIPFSDEQRQFIVGSILGNGKLKKCGKKGFQLHVEEKSELKSRLLWKKMILGNFVNVIHDNDKKSFFKTSKHNDFNFYQKLFYDNNKKVVKEELIDYLTSFGLFVWFLDSAIIRKDNIRFSTYKYSQEEQEILQRIFKVNFMLNCKICEYVKNNNKYYYLSFNKRNSQLLMNIIKPQMDRSSETIR